MHSDCPLLYIFFIALCFLLLLFWKSNIGRARAVFPLTTSWPCNLQPVHDPCRTTWMPWWACATTAWRACSTSASSPAWQPVPSPSCCVPSPGPGDRLPAGEWAPCFLPSCFQQLFWEKKKCRSGVGLFIDLCRFLLLVPVPVFWAGFFLFFSCQSP